MAALNARSLNAGTPKMLLVSGTFAVGWTTELADAIRARLGNDNVRVIGRATCDDPFAQLLHRVENVREAKEAGEEIVMCACPHDAATRRRPEIETLLRDLTTVLLPDFYVDDEPRHLVVHADPHAYFAKCVADGAQGTQHELVCAAATCWNHPGGGGVNGKSVSVPPHATETPGLLAAVLEKHLVPNTLKPRAVIITN